MDRLRFSYPHRMFMLRNLCPRRWLPACFFLMILPGLLLLGPVPGALGASITVNPSQVQGYINPLIFGQNFLFSGTNIWDHRVGVDSINPNMLDATNVTIKSRIEGLASTILRFPGGTASDLYLWEDGLGFLTTNTAANNSDLVLDGFPRSWDNINGAYNTYSWDGTVGRGLIVDKIQALGDAFKWGDPFNFTSVSAQTLQSISEIGDTYNPNLTHPAGVSVRPGARPGQYHQYWQDHLDNPDPNNLSREWLNSYGIVEHMRLVNHLGAEALITVNYMTGLDVASGTVSSTDAPLDQKIRRAQALVAFCNGRTNDTRSLGNLGGIDWHTVGYWARKRAALGFPQPFEVRYWEVGNEPYYGIFMTSPGPPKIFQHPAVLASTYAAHFNQFAQKMKEVDPKIRVGAVGMMRGQTSDLDESDTTWNNAVLNITKNDLDFLSIHPYYPAADKNSPYWFTAVMAGATQALSDLQTIRSTINSIASSRGNNIGLVATEYGIWPLGEGVDARDVSNLAGALYLADLTMGLIQQTGGLRFAAATSWNLYANDKHAAIGNIWDWPIPRTTRPQYYALKMLREALVGKQLVETSTTSFFLPSWPGLGNVTNLPVHGLGTWAAVSSGTPAKLTLVVINRSQADIPNVSIDHSGFTQVGVTVLGVTPLPYQVGKELGDNNESDANNVITQTGSYNNPYTFPRNSLTVFEFQAQ